MYYLFFIEIPRRTLDAGPSRQWWEIDMDYLGNAWQVAQTWAQMAALGIQVEREERPIEASDKVRGPWLLEKSYDPGWYHGLNYDGERFKMAVAEDGKTLLIEKMA